MQNISNKPITEMTYKEMEQEYYENIEEFHKREREIKRLQEKHCDFRIKHSRRCTELFLAVLNKVNG